MKHQNCFVVLQSTVKLTSTAPVFEHKADLGTVAANGGFVPHSSHSSSLTVRNRSEGPVGVHFDRCCVVHACPVLGVELSFDLTIASAHALGLHRVDNPYRNPLNALSFRGIVMLFRAFLLVLFSSFGAANAATLNFNTLGKLTGATGVTIGTSTYNVEFKDGTCQSVFNGCDEVSDLDFIGAAAAAQAGQALLDQVFIGAVDNDHFLQFGCGSGGGNISCVNLIPHGPSFNYPNSGVIGFDATRVVNFNNSVPPTVLDGVYSSPFRANEQTTNGVFSYYVFADFEKISAVPLPADGLFLMSGLAGLAALRRRKKRAA